MTDSPVAQMAALPPGRMDHVTTRDVSRTQPGDSDSTSVRSAWQEAGDKNARSSWFANPDEGFTFWDFLDIINPLQHIPLVNTVYREITGDQIGAAARVLGGAMFGPIGLIGGALDVAFSEITGDTLGGHVVALFKGDDRDSQSPGIAIAADKSSSLPFSGSAAEEMTALDAGVLLPMTSPVFVPSHKAGQTVTQTPASPVFSTAAAPVMTVASSIDMSALLTIQETGIQKAEATGTLPQPGYMPLNRNKSTFMPLGNQPRTAMPLPGVSQYQRQDETMTSPALPISDMAVPTDAINAYPAF